MKFLPLTPEIRQTIGSIGIILLVAGLGIMLVSSGTGVDSYASSAQRAVQEVMAAFELKAPMAEAAPMRLRIPDIYVDTTFVDLGLEENGEIEVPEGYQEVGWYTKGPTPGELGPAVVLGHVDSYEGPGVFLTLGQLQPGDYVYVDREDGSTATFRVTALERYDRDAFPKEKVYGDIDHAGLRLVTCSGTFNRDAQEYSRLLVVYAALVEDGQAQ